MPEYPLLANAQFTEQIFAPFYKKGDSGKLSDATACYNLPQLWRFATLDWNLYEDYPMATTSIRLDQYLIEKATIMAKALNRTPPKQIEHWAKIGEIMESNPDLPYEFVKNAIIADAEKQAGKLESYDFG